MAANVYMKGYVMMKVEVWFNRDTTAKELIDVLQRVDPDAKVSTVYVSAVGNPSSATKSFNIDFTKEIERAEHGTR